MQFLTVEVGSPDLAFPPDTSLAVPFAFPQPVRRVHCALQGFDIGYPENDHHLAVAQIESRVEFDDLASTTSGTLRVHFHFRDDSTGFGSAYGATLYARFLIVGE
jgi:hypothetical protein